MIHLLLSILIVGVIIGLIIKYIEMPEVFKTILLVVGAIWAILAAARIFGLA